MKDGHSAFGRSLWKRELVSFIPKVGLSYLPLQEVNSTNAFLTQTNLQVSVLVGRDLLRQEDLIVQRRHLLAVELLHEGGKMA